MLLQTQRILLLILSLLVFPLLARMQLNDTLPALMREIRQGEKRQYQIVQNQTLRYYLSPQSKILQPLEKECHIHPAYISVTPVASLMLDSDQMQKRYAFNKIQKSLYQLTDKGITRFEINWLLNNLSKKGTLNFTNKCKKNILQQWDQQKMYIFSCQSIYSIDSRSMMKIGEIFINRVEFNSFKIVRFAQLIFQVSANQGLNIYTIDFSLNLLLLGTITKYKDHNLHISDIFYNNGNLYILDHKNGLYIYNRQNSQFKQKDSLRLNPSQPVQYRLLTIRFNSIYIVLAGNGQNVVMQCSLVNDIFYLVRYYKGYGQIQKLSIFQNKLLIQSRQKIQLLPINRDPRIISQANNGYTYTHDIQIRQLHYLQDSKFLIASQNLIQIIMWNVKESKLQCSFPYTGSYSIIYQFPCAFNMKDPFYNVCTVFQKLQISVLTSHKDNYIWLLFIVAGIFILGVIALIYWREDKTQQIGKIIRKIKQFKQKFQPKAQSVQFQQVQHAYSQNQSARQRNLQDLKIDQSQLQQKDQVNHHYDQLVSQRLELSNG